MISNKIENFMRIFIMNIQYVFLVLSSCKIFEWDEIVSKIYNSVKYQEKKNLIQGLVVTQGDFTSFLLRF